MLVQAFIVSLALAQGYAPPRQGTDPLDPSREAHVQALGKQLRCAVCQGVSIADSPASMARAQLDKVRELVAEGKSDDEIYEYFVERYGEWALMEPRKSGVTLGLWVFPLILLAVGLIIIFASAQKKGPLPTVAPTGPAAPEPSPDDAFLRQVRADLEK
jgi:cytochrome c-type biogenesis protein CcmH